MWTCAAISRPSPGPKIVYERLLNFCDDAGTKDALQFLMTREITHMKAFMIALESLGKDPLSIGQIPPDSGRRRSILQRLDRQGRARRDRLPWPLEPGQRLAIRRGPRVSGPPEDTRVVVTSSRPRNLRTEPAVPRTVVDGMPNNL